MNFTLEHAKHLRDSLKPKRKDCKYCNGTGYKYISVEHEEIRDCHRSGGFYYTKEKVKCFSCKE